MVIYYSMRYRSVSRDFFKTLWNIKGLVEDHHVIPKQFRGHPTVKKYKYDMNCSTNIILLPTKHGKHVMNLRENRLVHDGNHYRYNLFVEQILNVIQTEKDLKDFVIYLKKSCRFNPENIPW